MSRLRTERTWADVLVDNAAEIDTAERLIRQLNACEVAALAFCRLLERWARGDAAPSTAGGRQAALRRAADRAETALAGVERPLGRYLLELEPERAEGRSWYGAPGAAELLEGAPASMPRRCGSRRPTSSSRFSCARSRASGTPPASARPQSAAISGPVSSISARTCSAGPSKTSARWPPSYATGRAGSDLDVPDPRLRARRARRPAARPEPARARAGRALRAPGRAGADEGAVGRQAAAQGLAGDAGAAEPGTRERRRQARALGRRARPREGAAGALPPDYLRATGLPRRRRRAGRDA